MDPASRTLASNSSSFRLLLDKFLLRARQRNTIYVFLTLSARVFNAVGMFIAIRRFAPSAFGEMSYLQATAASTVAFCAFGIDMSVNSRLTRKLNEKAPLGPTVLAACALALAGVLLSFTVIVLGFSSQLTMLTSLHAALLVLGIYSSFLILVQLCSATSFALVSSVNVGVANLLTAMTFATCALFAHSAGSGERLMLFTITGQSIAISWMVAALIRQAPRGAAAVQKQALRPLLQAAVVEAKVLFSYGAKQILVVSAVTFSQWLIQRKIMFGAEGTAQNAVYSVGNQIFNMMNFIPGTIGPIIVTRLAAAGTDKAQRRQICLSSLRLFAAIAICACIGVFVGLHFGIPYLPARYAAATEAGLLSSIAAGIQILRTPISMYFLSELKASREIASATMSATFMIVVTSLFTQLSPNQGTLVRLLGCALQAVVLTTFFLIETRRSSK